MQVSVPELVMLLTPSIPTVTTIALESTSEILFTSQTDRISMATSNMISMTDETTTTDTAPTTFIITGAVIGAAVVIIIAVTAILCIVISIKKYYKRKSSINLPSADSEKSPNRDGYVNALYDSKSTKFYLDIKFQSNTRNFLSYLPRNIHLML